LYQSALSICLINPANPCGNPKARRARQGLSFITTARALAAEGAGMPGADYRQTSPKRWLESLSWGFCAVFDSAPIIHY